MLKRSFAIFIALLLFITSGFCGDVYVKGYYKKSGTYVQPHYRTSPNSTRNDNYSTEGNTNPYTGEKGYKKRDENSWNSWGTDSTKKKRSSIWDDD